MTPVIFIGRSAWIYLICCTALFLWSLHPLAANSTEPIIISKRTDCLRLGGCPVYEIRIFEDGRVIYDGRHRVATTGSRTIQIGKDAVNRLRYKFEAVNFIKIDTSESAIDRIITPCTSFTLTECIKLSEAEKAQLKVEELCQKIPAVKTQLLTTRDCHLGDELVYRDGVTEKKAGPDNLKDTKVMENLSRLRQRIEEISRASVLIFGDQANRTQ